MMATLLKNQPAIPRTLSPTTTGSGSVYINPNEFLFYSNDPETFHEDDLADNGKFLCRENVSGNGQIYVWHHNATNMVINHTILVYNANNFDVTVEASNYGLTNTTNTALPDTVAWQSYYNGQATQINVAAKGYANLFPRWIGNGNNFGIVARVNIYQRGNKSVAAGVTMFDLVYDTNSGGGTNYASPDDPKRRRGKGGGYYCTMTLPRTAPINSTGIGYSYGASANTFFKGQELSYIQDSGNQGSGILEGGFGMQFNITIPVYNATGISQKFRIFMGSRGGHFIPFVNFNGDIATSQTITDGSGMKYMDVIETDILAPNQVRNYTFSTVIPALSDTPYMVGVRCLD